jgi:hypothetical protein
VLKLVSDCARAPVEPAAEVREKAWADPYRLRLAEVSEPRLDVEGRRSETRVVDNATQKSGPAVVGRDDQVERSLTVSLIARLTETDDLLAHFPAGLIQPE